MRRGTVALAVASAAAPRSLSAMVWARVMEMVDMRSTMRMKSLRLLRVEYDKVRETTYTLCLTCAA